MNEITAFNQLRPAIVREAEDARSIVQFIEQAAKEIESKFIAIGKYLCKMYDRELYRDLGYKSIWEFIDANPNLNFERRTAEMLMRIWRFFGEGGKFPISTNTLAEVGYAKSYLLTRLYEEGVLTKENLNDWIQKAKENTYRKFKLFVDEALGKEPPSEEELNWKTVSFRIPPGYEESIEEAINVMAQIEGVEEQEEIKKRRGDFLVKILEDWVGYYSIIYQKEELRNNEALKEFKLRQVKGLIEKTFEDVVLVVIDRETNRRIL